MYIIAQVNFSTIANIDWLIQTFKNQCCGFQVHFKSKLEHNLKTKRDLWSKCPHYIMGYIINLGSMFFIFSLVSNLAYIDHSLCQIWSVYMQYMWRYDHSNKCLFLVIQQAEVLLNFFGECTHSWNRRCWYIHHNSYAQPLQWRHNGRLKTPASPLFTQPFIQAQIKENIKAPRHWPLCGEFTGDRWIPRTNGQ